MALNYQQLTAASEDATFKSRVKAALLTACIAIAADAPNTAIDNRRDRFARQCLQNPEGATAQFSLPVALGFGAKSNATLTDATDAEIDTRVAAVFNDLMP